MSKKAGVNTSTIINTRGGEHYAIMKKNDTKKKNRAKTCIDCKDNNEGYCNKHKDWGNKVNYICNGVKDPYAYKLPPKTKQKFKKKKSKRKKSKN